MFRVSDRNVDGPASRRRVQATLARRSILCYPNIDNILQYTRIPEKGVFLLEFDLFSVDHDINEFLWEGRLRCAQSFMYRIYCTVPVCVVFCIHPFLFDQTYV